MKIFVSHPKELDYINELYKPIRESKLNNKHEFYLPHEDNKQVNTQDVIKNSDLVLAEVSFPATGQGIELGWASILKVPIVCASKEGNKISGSLKYLTNNFITYKTPEELIEKLSAYLETK